MKKYRAIYFSSMGLKNKSKWYQSLGVCKRFTKKFNPVAYEELEITYLYDKEMRPIKKNQECKLIVNK